MGVAVQSHWFSVGSVVSWARAGVGAVATQSIGEPSYGPNALDLLAGGATPEEALARLTAADERAPFRQVAVVDAAGRVATHTGASLHRVRRPPGGRRLQRPGEHDGRARRYGPRWRAASRASSGPLARRLIAALRAAEGAGGDVRGRQSAAIVVAPRRGRAVAPERRPARRGPPRAARRDRAPARPRRRLSPRERGRRPRRPGPPRRGVRALRRAPPSSRPATTSSCSGRGCRPPRAATWTTARRARAGARSRCSRAGRSCSAASSPRSPRARPRCARRSPSGADGPRAPVLASVGGSENLHETWTFLRS